MNEDLKIIKKKYGEEFMHYCRENFPILLETPKLLPNLILKHFDASRQLYEDIKNNNLKTKFKNYIYSLVNVDKTKIQIGKTPKELLDEAGYDFYECKTEADIQEFKKYYTFDEQLCTFNGNRLDRCYVFWAVKKNVNEIKRENFQNPKREDEYGTSVISIQFTRDEFHTLSIKNRYNHRVNNPDATFSNNLNSIISGLSESFENTYGLVQKNKSVSFEIPGYVLANDEKYYKYNSEYNNIYYCPNNVIIHNFEVKKYDKEKYIIMDYFILDLKNKSISLYDLKRVDNLSDSFKNNIKINIKNIDKYKEVKINNKNGQNCTILLDDNNCIISLESNLKFIGDYFLYRNYTIKKLSLSNVEYIGDYFISNNTVLSELSLPKVKSIGDYFLYKNKKIKNISLPEVKSIGNCFITENLILSELNIPSIKKVRDNFLQKNRRIIKLNLPQIEKVGDRFLRDNMILDNINIPLLEQIGSYFLFENSFLTKLNMPSIKKIGDHFLYNNEELDYLFMPNIEEIGSNVLYSNNKITKLNLPKVKKIGSYFLLKNEILSSINIPNIEQIGDGFLLYNLNLKKIDISNIKNMGLGFLGSNTQIKDVIAPQHIYEEYKNYIECLNTIDNKINGETNEEIDNKRHR